MLSRTFRLRKTTDIERVYATGRKAYHPLVRCIIAPGTRPTSRVAIVVSQRVSKNAVDRNKIRRRVRSIFQQHISRFAHPYDIVIIAQPTSLQASYEEIEIALTKLFSQKKLYAL